MHNSDLNEIASQLSKLSNVVQSLLKQSSSGVGMRVPDINSSSSLSRSSTKKQPVKKTLSRRHSEVALFLADDDSYSRLRNMVQKHSHHVAEMENGL
jgi:DNA anti-recombination protein RmuC